MIIPMQLMPWNSYLYSMGARSTNLKRQYYISPHYINAHYIRCVFINKHLGVIWLFQCSSYPETHTCTLWMQSDRREMSNKVDITSIQIIPGSVFTNIGVISSFQWVLSPTTHTCSLWVQSLWGTMLHKIHITSMPIISGSVFLNKYVGVTWLFQCSSYPETHDCAPWI